MKREIIDLFATPVLVAAASASQIESVSSVDNSQEGVCPKCAAPMGTGIIPLGVTYYCAGCRVATPVPEV